jgi:hypothetical protein
MKPVRDLTANRRRIAKPEAREVGPIAFRKIAPDKPVINLH